MLQYVVYSGLIVLVLFAIVLFWKKSAKHRSKRDALSGYGKDVSEYELKNINALRKVYRFDFEKNLVEIPLSFDHVEEMLDASLSNEEVLSVSSSFVEELIGRIAAIPDKFAVNLKLSFGNCGAHPVERILDAVQDRIEEFYTKALVSNKKYHCRTLIYIILCVVFSILATISVSVHYVTGVETSYSMIIRILLENAGLMILWQAGSTILGIIDSADINNLSLYRRINGICCTGEGNTVVSRDKEELTRYWHFITKREKYAHAIILVANAYVFVIFVVEAITFVTSGIDLSPFNRVLFTAEWIFTLFITITNLSYYFDRGPLARYAFRVSLVYVVMLAVYNVSRLVYNSMHGIAFNYDDFLFTYLMISVLNSICIFLIQKERKMRTDYLLQEISK